MTPKKQSYEKLANTIIKNFAKRNIEGYYCTDRASATTLAMELMKDAKTVGAGGSESIKECGLLDTLKASSIHFIDRSVANTPEERKSIFLETMACDFFLMSSNAVTMDGELVNIDGNGNRLACLLHGPEHILMIVGMNKVMTDVDSAIARVQNIAAPPNAARLGTNTPCSLLGHCGNCHAEDCMCCQIVITRHSRQKGRIKVILVGEELGY